MPLGSMVIGAWLIALGLAAALVIAQRDLSRLLVSGVTYTVFGVLQAVAVIWHWPQLSRHDVSLWLYLTTLAAVVLTGAVRLVGGTAAGAATGHVRCRICGHLGDVAGIRSGRDGLRRAPAARGSGAGAPGRRRAAGVHGHGGAAGLRPGRRQRSLLWRRPG